MPVWRSIRVVLGKEVMDNARDHRSLLVALVYPLLGPMLLGLLLAAAVGAVGAKSTTRMVLPVQGGEHAPELIGFLRDQGVAVVPAPDDPEEAVRRGDVATVLIIPPRFADDIRAERLANVSVIINSSRLPGLVAVSQAKQFLANYNQHVLETRAAARGIGGEVLKALEIDNVNVAASTHLIGLLLLMVPPLFIFNLFMGGVYLAIDTTSGERERGSLEPLLINPVPRWALMLGKYLAALFYTAVAVCVQLVAFMVIFNRLQSPDPELTLLISPSMMLWALVITVPLMMVAVGLQVIIATVTRSFKEAQTYLGFLPLVPALPGLVLVFSPVHTQGWMMSLPIFSQTLLLGQVVRGEPIAGLHVLLSMSTSVAVAGLLLAIAARLYESEKLLFGG